MPEEIWMGGPVSGSMALRCQPRTELTKDFTEVGSPDHSQLVTQAMVPSWAGGELWTHCQPVPESCPQTLFRSGSTDRSLTQQGAGGVSLTSGALSRTSMNACRVWVRVALRTTHPSST